MKAPEKPARLAHNKRAHDFNPAGSHSLILALLVLSGIQFPFTGCHGVERSFPAVVAPLGAPKLAYGGCRYERESGELAALARPFRSAEEPLSLQRLLDTRLNVVKW